MGRSHVEGMATYRLTDGTDAALKAWTMAEHRLRVAASLYGGAPDGEIAATTHTVNGVVLVRMRVKLRITTNRPVAEL